MSRFAVVMFAIVASLVAVAIAAPADNTGDLKTASSIGLGYGLGGYGLGGYGLGGLGGYGLGGGLGYGGGLGGGYGLGLGGLGYGGGLGFIG